MSEMISEMAGHFISLGKTPEEKHSRLTALVAAWNMACGSPEDRHGTLSSTLKDNQRFNPATYPGDLAGIRSDMESLIGRKLAMFPEDQRQIVSAKIVMVGEDYRIEVASPRCSDGSKGEINNGKGESKSPSPFEGRWRITSMEMWSQDVVDAEVEGFVEFGPNGLAASNSPMSAAHQTSGQHQRRKAQRRVVVDGNDEMDPAKGRGWA